MLPHRPHYLGWSHRPQRPKPGSQVLQGSLTLTAQFPVLPRREGFQHEPRQPPSAERFTWPRPQPDSLGARALPSARPLAPESPASSRRPEVWTAGVIPRVKGSRPSRARQKQFLCLPFLGRQSAWVRIGLLEPIGCQQVAGNVGM